MRVFISHDFKDSKSAQKIANFLRNDGFEVWDDSQILPGENWAEAIGKALEESEAMVVLLTPNSVNSSYISYEVGYALGRKEYKGRLIPVIAANPEQLESIDIPWVFSLQQFQIIRISNLEKDEESLKQISQALKTKAKIISQPIETNT